MKAGVTREDYLSWFKCIDEGTFPSRSCGERVNGPPYNMGPFLAAAAVATEHVEINSTLYVLPMHSAVSVAREIATIDNHSCIDSSQLLLYRIAKRRVILGKANLAESRR